ncbi:MAG TPA: FKBP-type peptidyl-prolyl cis-trans isomerase [Polyangiaceae bacterium]|nr:FKBP-type peptidyl-prolyl cis-trans isomerase [Polyangiaceae bacterium]
MTSRTRSLSLVLAPFLALLAACDSSSSPSGAPSAKPETLPPAVATSARPAAQGTATAPRPTAIARPEPPKPASIPAPPDVAAPPQDAKKTASGLASKVIEPGKGKQRPKAEDLVKVHYTGWTKDGAMFDTSSGGEPVSFPVNKVIKGWTEGLQLMVEGEKRRFWIPSALAYGDKPEMGAPAGDLVFDVELLSFQAAPKPPPAPADVRAAPKDATKTASGLAYKLLKKGTGKRKPKATDTVTVHYTGWTPDGKMFDSSIPTSEPVSFPLGRVIKGWTEGLQLMSEGDSMRFWIPSELAYGDKPKREGAPAGMLVFDVELLSIQ